MDGISYVVGQPKQEIEFGNYKNSLGREILATYTRALDANPPSQPPGVSWST
jgi:hypothetical protein